MALYEDYLNQNNLYSRPSALMSDVNSYLGANQAQLPQTPGSLGAMTSGPSSLISDAYKDKNDYLGDIDDTKDPDPDDTTDPIKPKGDLLSRFVQDLGALTSDQQELLLGFITGSGGDKLAGVSAEEYSQLFNIDEKYAHRFQGFPQLTTLASDISNVYAFGDQQRGFEQRAAQQAMASQTQQNLARGRGFAGFGATGRTSALNRRTMMETLKQRQASVGEAQASKYSNLLSALQGNIRGGFTAASQILQQNPLATWSGGDDSGGGDPFTPEGWTEADGYGAFTDKYGMIWEHDGGQWRQQDR